MQLTEEHYRIAAVAYCKQTGGKSLATGDTLPAFEGLRESIKDAWAASVAIALLLDVDIHSATDRPNDGAALMAGEGYPHMGKQTPQLVDGFLRRCRTDLMTPAEIAVLAAVYAIERLGADVRLTGAVNLLSEARDKIADYVEATANSVTPDSSVFLANLTLEEYRRFEADRFLYSGATGAGAKPELYEGLAPYVATFFSQLGPAMKAFGWNRLEITRRDGCWIARGSRRSE